MTVMLKNWKSIAAYLAVSVRTAQRWHASHGMPVHRLPGASKVAFALAKELDEWMERTPVRPEACRETTEASQRPIPHPGGSTVLAVDDNDVHLYALHKALTAAGFRVLGARSGSEAITKAFQFMPETILLDVHLPDVTGFEVCRRLKAEKQTAAIPIILHTAIDDSYEARQQARVLGAAAFLAYPMHYQTMLAIIKASVAPGSWPTNIDKFNFDTTSRLDDKR